jgi:hypothetical protein
VDKYGAPVAPVASLVGLDAMVLFKSGPLSFVLMLVRGEIRGYDAVYFDGARCTGRAYIQRLDASLPMSAVGADTRLWVDAGTGDPQPVKVASWGQPEGCFDGAFVFSLVPATLAGDLAAFTPPFSIQ